MNKLAIAVGSFNNPEYLKQTLDSLSNNVGKEEADIWLYQDGSVNPISHARYVKDDSAIDESVELFRKAKLPNKFMKIEIHNMGAGLQRLSLFDDLFRHGYEYVVCLDGDNVVSRYYIVTLLKLFEQFESNPNIGIIQTSLRDYRDIPLNSPKKCRAMANQVQHGFSRRWEQGLYKRSWLQIRPMLGTLIGQLRGTDFKQLLNGNPELEYTRNLLLAEYGTFHVDEAIENCVLLQGMQGICTRIPRHIGIGVHGFYTFNPSLWKSSGLDQVPLRHVEPPNRFVLANNPLCVTIRTINRPETFKQCLASLAQNKQYQGVDFLIYIDGAVNPHSGQRYAAESDKIRCLEVAQNVPLPNKRIYVAPENKGTAWQKYEMLDGLFPAYDYVMMLDNDVVVDTTYLATVQKLFGQFANDPKAGILHTSACGRKVAERMEREVAKRLADKVQYGFGHRWEAGFWRKTWEDIKPYYMRYLEFAGAVDYKELISSQQEDKGQEILKLFPDRHADSALEFSAFREGYLGIRTKAYRHRSIGHDGMYSFRTREIFEEAGFHLVNIYDLPVPDHFSFIAPIQYAEDLCGLLGEEDIWVVGSGASLDSYPDSFLDDKIGVTLHMAYLKYPDATYRGVCESPIIAWLLKNRPEFFTKPSIFTYPFHPREPAEHFLGTDLGTSQNWPPPIFVRYIGDESYLFGTTFEDLIGKAACGEPIIAGAYSTVLHSILFALITMGAKNIHLIGCDHKKGDTVYYSLAQEVEALELRVRYRPDSWYSDYMCERQRYGTQAFITEGKKHGIRIKRYEDYSKVPKRFRPRTSKHPLQVFSGRSTLRFGDEPESTP